MNHFKKEFTGLISYEMLSKYHLSAKVLYEGCLKRNEPFEVDYTHEILLRANDADDAGQQFVEYATLLNDKGIFYHLSHIAYIVRHWQEMEGSFTDADTLLHKHAKLKIQQLISIIKLRDSPQHLVLEVGGFGKYGQSFTLKLITNSAQYWSLKIA